MRPHNTHSYTLSVCSVSLSWLPITIVLAMVLLFLVLLTRLGTTNPYHTDCLMFTNIYISTICLSTFLPPTCFSVISVNCISCVTIFCCCCFRFVPVVLLYFLQLPLILLYTISGDSRHYQQRTAQQHSQGSGV